MNGQSFTDSQEALAYLQSKYGSANYRSWQSLRKEWWSYVQYNTAGQNVLNFFGDAIGQNNTTRQLTNLPKSGSFGQNHFLLKGIRCDYYMANYEVDNTFVVDADLVNSDIINGIFQAGVFELLIGDRVFTQIPKPFLYAPPADGRTQVYAEGLRALTLAEGTPNTFTSLRTAQPHAELLSRHQSKFIIDPNILIEAEQHFECRISYPTGALATICTNVANNTTNPMYVGVVLDGIVFRPVQ